MTHPVTPNPSVCPPAPQEQEKPEDKKRQWWVHRAFDSIWLLPLNVEVESDKVGEHICKAHEDRLNELRAEIAQLARQYEAANRAYSASIERLSAPATKEKQSLGEPGGTS
jgi:hypothetical protein